MKKIKFLSLIVATLVVTALSGCGPEKTTIGVDYDFQITSNANSQAGKVKIEEYFKSLGFPVGEKVRITIETDQEGGKALELATAEVKRIVGSVQNKPKPSEIIALGTGATWIAYTVTYHGLSTILIERDYLID